MGLSVNAVKSPWHRRSDSMPGSLKRQPRRTKRCVADQPWLGRACRCWRMWPKHPRRVGSAVKSLGMAQQRPSWIGRQASLYGIPPAAGHCPSDGCSSAIQQGDAPHVLSSRPIAAKRQPPCAAAPSQTASPSQTQTVPAPAFCRLPIHLVAPARSHSTVLRRQ